jgi:hypothetical protein
MYFAIVGIDRPEVTDVGRPAHREYLHARLGGPLLAPDGEAMISSLIVIEAQDLAAAERRPLQKSGSIREGLGQTLELDLGQSGQGMRATVRQLCAYSEEDDDKCLRQWSTNRMKDFRNSTLSA